MDRNLIAAFLIGIALALAVAGVRFNRAKLHRQANSAAPSKSQDVKSSCRARDLSFGLPIEGMAGRDWLIAQYQDSDPSVGRVLDYTGATGERALTYDGHSGLDFELPGFRAMDRGVAVLAALDGVVEEAYAESPDRSRTCGTDKWNYVKLRHANGFASIYAHLRKHSVSVRVGDRISAGQRLGFVGSSGCSSYPHLHFEVVDCQDRYVDAIAEGLFRSPPPEPRSSSPSVMEISVFQPAIHDLLPIQDPGSTDVERATLGVPLSVGVTLSYLHEGDVISIQLLSPSNTIGENSFTQRSDRFHTRSHWWSNFVLNQPGTWLARINVNGRSLADRPILAVE